MIGRQIRHSLQKRIKKFQFNKVEKNARSREYSGCIEWLKDAGVSIPVYNIDDLKIPLILSKSRSLFKLFMNDIGLLAAEYSQGIQLRILTLPRLKSMGFLFHRPQHRELRLTRSLGELLLQLFSTGLKFRMPYGIVSISGY